MKKALMVASVLFLAGFVRMAVASPVGDFFLGIEPGDSFDVIFDKLSNASIVKNKKFIISADLPEGVTDHKTGCDFVLIRNKSDLPDKLAGLSLIIYPHDFKTDNEKAEYYDIAYSNTRILSFKFKNKTLTEYGFFEMPEYFQKHQSLKDRNSFIDFFRLTDKDYTIEKGTDSEEFMSFTKDYGSYTFKGQLHKYDEGYSLFAANVNSKNSGK